MPDSFLWFLFWGDRRDLNPQPLAPQASALPIELQSPYFLVPPAGIEPAANGLENHCSIL